MDAEFPEKLQCLFQPMRYKVLYGGRGAGRSWNVARALLLIGTGRAIRVLCCRELQNSIAESVHKVLSDQITALGLDHFYDVQVAKIIGKNGTTFSFEGIKNNAAKIKSYEGIDYCWVEEANKVSKASWDFLDPTIRKEWPRNWRELGMAKPEFESEIWITFNPELETDYTYKNFVLNPPKNAFVVKMNWRDNPWFPEVLRKQMLETKERDPDAYLNIWEGNTIQALNGAVYAKELRLAVEEGRIGKVPWDRETPVDTFWDLGRRDHTCIWFAQKVAMQYRVLAYFEGSQEDIHYYLQECQRRPYTYGTFYLPHDGKAKTLGTKRSIEEIVRASGRVVKVLPRLSKVDGINAARIIFPNCWFDEKNCEMGIERLRHYKFRVIDGQLSKEPLHDENSDGADAFRTLAVAIKGPKKESKLAEKLERMREAFQGGEHGLGWMA